MNIINHIFVVFSAILLLISCKDEVKTTQAQPAESDTTSQQDQSPLVHRFDNPSFINSELPRLFSYDNILYMSWVTRTDSTDRLYFSKYLNKRWQEAQLVAEGANWFTNWADFPVIAANRKQILTSHLQKSADGTYTYDIILNLIKQQFPNPSIESKGQKVQYIKENFVLHNDGTKSEHGFVSMMPYEDNSFFVTWLDGRNTVGETHKDDIDHSTMGPMTLRSAVIPATGEIAQRTELDARVCDCCQTSVAMTDQGPIVAYRDRSDEEIRDISVMRFANGNWTPSQTVGNDQWKIPGCPVNGPSIDAIDCTVALAWFTAAKGEGDVQVAFSTDSGAHFLPAFRIDRGNATGRVDIELLDKNHAAVLWMQPNDEEDAIYLMKVHKSGKTGKPILISKTTADRSSGFPQLSRVDDSLIVAFTKVNDGATQISTVQLALKRL